MTTLQSIASNVAQPGASRPGGAGILQTQLNRYETQLADWCNCPSGKTPEGKQIITDLQQKADAIKVQLGQLDASARPASPQVTSGVQPTPYGGTSISGSRLDVYA